MAKKGYIQKKKVTYWLHTLLSCIHDDEDFAITLDQILKRKQNVLISGKTIKKVNGLSLLGSGEIQIVGVEVIDKPEGDDGGGGEEPETPIVKIIVDDHLDNESENPVQNKVIYLALDDKQVKLVSGTNIKTINGQSVLGAGNIDAKSDCDTYLSVVDGAVCITYNT